MKHWIKKRMEKSDCPITLKMRYLICQFEFHITKNGFQALFELILAENQPNIDISSRF
jgi:hypothetical protein